GQIVLEISRAASEAGVQLPQEMALLGKALLNLDQVARTLDPTFDPNATVRQQSTELLRQRMWKSVSRATSSPPPWRPRSWPTSGAAARALPARAESSPIGSGRIGRRLQLLEEHPRGGESAVAVQVEIPVLFDVQAVHAELHDALRLVLGDLPVDDDVVVELI